MAAFAHEKRSTDARVISQCGTVITSNTASARVMPHVNSRSLWRNNHLNTICGSVDLGVRFFMTVACYKMDARLGAPNWGVRRGGYGMAATRQGRRMLTAVLVREALFQ